MEFSYKDVVETFFLKHQISAERKGAFKGRLQHFQRLGFPPGINTGKGKAASYKWRELILLGLALEYAEIGSTPDRSVAEVTKFSDVLISGVAQSLVVNDGPEEERKAFLCIEVSALLPLKNEEDWNQEIQIFSVSEMRDVFSEFGVASMNSPYAIIDIRQFLAGLLTSMGEVLEASPSDIVSSLKLWARTTVDYHEGLSQ